MEYSKIKRKCPAKINLFLKILGKRADNYHNLYSLMAFIDLYDELNNINRLDAFPVTLKKQKYFLWGLEWDMGFLPFHRTINF